MIDVVLFLIIEFNKKERNEIEEVREEYVCDLSCFEIVTNEYVI
jgi:hypothetical protein